MDDEVCHLDRRSPKLPKAGPPMTFSIGMLFVRSPSSHSPQVILNVCPASCVGGSPDEIALAGLVLTVRSPDIGAVLFSRGVSLRLGRGGRNKRNHAGSVSRRDGLRLLP